ncbi:MAG TPA: tRNA (guanosine(46)-N7)-methyltransferase TrmB [Candidatus Saccharimonadales bacterium]|nr:tRNA (guanosine(46)-N7)-methyltransferase TrmB [Candidatus Saccharimonadales bacterium]
MAELNPKDFIITRKRKKYKFALFHNSPLCFEIEEWHPNREFDVLEMGAGTGLFSVELASHNKTGKYVAVDVKADRLQTGARAAGATRLDNIQFLRARADQLDTVISPASLSSIWITFPDPFPKKRAAKHRLTHSHFLAFYERWLLPTGAIYFKTDARELFDWSLEELVREGWRIEELSFDLHTSDLPDEYKIHTTYETRYIREGKLINFVKATPPRQAKPQAVADT